MTLGSMRREALAGRVGGGGRHGCKHQQLETRACAACRCPCSILSEPGGFLATHAPASQAAVAVARDERLQLSKEAALAGAVGRSAAGSQAALSRLLDACRCTFES